MGVFEMVVLIVFIATVGKVADSLVSRGGGSDAAARARIAALEAQLLANEARVAQSEERVMELGEKLDFVESLLAQPGSPSRLPEGNDGC
jgi:hypothetical protein